MRSALSLCVALLATMICASKAEAGSIGPTCGSCQGSVYSLTNLGLAPSDLGGADLDTWRILLTIDTSGYTGSGVAIDSVALKISSAADDAKLVSAPGGLSSWTLVPGGLSGGGCNGSGSGFECASYTGPSRVGAAVGGTLSWIFDVDVHGALFTDLAAASIKARYVTNGGAKTGDLVSENITLGPPTSVPEPSSALLLAAGVGIALWRRRRSARKSTAS